SDFQASTKTMLPKHLADAPAPIAQELTPEGEIADETGRQMERSFLPRFAQFLQPAPEPTDRPPERTVRLPLLTGARPPLSTPADIGVAGAGDGLGSALRPSKRKGRPIDPPRGYPGTRDDDRPPRSHHRLV